MTLIKNGKFFLPPSHCDDDFKTLFSRVAAAGVGRPVDRDGCPQGPWTPDLLAEAISEIEANRAGIELRTVQLWFEDNEKGISAANIRWLARVLGCNDPEAASAWQTELSAAQSRLAAKRRERRRGESLDWAETTEERHEPEALSLPEFGAAPRISRLARATEAIFTRGSLLNLPASVFAGAVALQFVSYFLSIHSVTYVRGDAVTKQVGFLWAPNWTLLFIVFLPLFLAIVVEQVDHWKNVNRARLLSGIDEKDRPEGWMTRVESSSHVFWVVFLICIGFAGVFQWVDVRLLPLLNGGGDYAVDWGSLALARPDQIGVSQQIAFTGAAYLYMSVCFYLLIAGLVLLSNLVDDVIQIQEISGCHPSVDRSREAKASSSRIMKGIIRCTIAGLLIAMCMKLESLYIVTSSPNILDWLVTDARLVVSKSGETVLWDDASTPTHYTSLLVAFLVCAVYLYGAIRIGPFGTSDNSLARATTAVVFLVVAYLLVGVFDGFSVLLGIGLLIALYGLFDPEFGFTWKEQRGRSYVS